MPDLLDTPSLNDVDIAVLRDLLDALEGAKIEIMGGIEISPTMKVIRNSAMKYLAKIGKEKGGDYPSPSYATLATFAPRMYNMLCQLVQADDYQHPQDIRGMIVREFILLQGRMNRLDEQMMLMKNLPPDPDRKGGG